MRKGSLFVAVCMVLLFAVQALCGDLVVAVKGVRNSKGKVLVAVFDNAKAFESNDSGKIRGAVVVPARQGEVRVTLHNFPAASLAVSVLHDENGNEMLDVNDKGYPGEGYGYSKNAGGLSSATFRDACILHKSDKATAVDITLHYID